MTISFIYKDHLVEITQHPIYNDYEYVIKTLGKQEIVCTNTRLIKTLKEVEIEVKTVINNINDIL